ncbi:MAG TPA: alpha/beta family hydrolase, partial [Dehalococcoidia bacterium]|nr:alpha/beta family hydrolase [Dehalococcoidia bacterium]
RFEFPYQQAGKRAPDRPEVLEDTWRAVIEAVRPARGRLAVGGRSMGGRIASHVVAQGMEVNALVLFAYPLHPPGRPELTRDAHLPAIAVPTLFCSGTNDAFASPEELQTAAAKVPRSSVCLLEGADHGFVVPKASGRTRQDVWAEALDATVEWLQC